MLWQPRVCRTPPLPCLKCRHSALDEKDATHQHEALHHEVPHPHWPERSEELVVQRLDSAPVSSEGELLGCEGLQKLGHRQWQGAHVQNPFDLKGLVVVDGAEGSADRNLKETPPSVGVRHGVWRDLGHLRDAQHPGALKRVQQIHASQGSEEESLLCWCARDARIVVENDV